MKQKKSKIEIITKDDTTTNIFLNGQDITENALSVTFKHAAGEVPTVTIEYLADECTVRTLGELIVKKKESRDATAIASRHQFTGSCSF